MPPTTAAAAAAVDDPPHILVFPYPAQGHMLALLDLSHQLALRGFPITIITTPKNLPALSPLLSAHPSAVQPLVLPFPPHPALPAAVENVKEVGNSGNIPIINALSNLHDSIIRWFASHHNPPVALISDFFLGWTEHLARRIDIPRVAFFAVRAFLACMIDSCLTDFGKVSCLSAVDFHDLPRSPSFKQEHLPSVLRICSRMVTPETEFVKESLMANSSSWGCVFSTFDALEGEYLRYLRNKLGHGRVYGVGPLNLIGFEERVVSENRICVAGCAVDVLEWLDGCPEESVLYVCFGSQKLLSRAQMEALAFGLEKSGVRFIWVVKTGSAEQAAEGNGVVPEGFDERVGGRGLVIRGWAPQVTIMNHRALGGFVSHCGWNSVLEAVVAGVRILAWPMEADQHVNARLLVEDMGVAVRVCEGADGVPDAVELGNVVAKVMSKDAPQKVRSKELRDAARAAVREGGSSAKDLDELVRELCKLPKPVGKRE